MPELAYQEKVTQEDTAIFGTKCIKDDYIDDYQDTGAWSLHRNAQPITKFKAWISPTVNQEYREITINGWTENEDPSTQVNLLESEDNKVQQLILQIMRASCIPNNARLANRLSNLFSAAKEEDPDSPGTSSDSIHSFYRFLEKHNNLKYPIITLTPDNEIYASWKGGHNQVFSVHFVSNENNHFVIFKPNENNPERKIISYGTDTADNLMKTVAFTGICDWISDER